MSKDRLLARLPCLAVAIILLYGAWLRTRWPLEPFCDADTWGYLHPALSKLTGGAFSHTYGRNFVYPGWVYLWLLVFRDFRAICCGQHLLGLATGYLLWHTWTRWREWFAQPRLPGWLATGLGLGLTAFYVSSTTVIFYEQQIRPEGIFPFFALLAICLTLEFLRAWKAPGAALPVAAWAGAVVFVAILDYQLKPSFGLTLGVAALPLLTACCIPGQTWGRRLLVPLGAAAGALLAFPLLLWPEHTLAQADELGSLFLPETLLTIHADIIRDQMAADLAHGNPTPYTNSWLTNLHDRLKDELVQAAQPDRKPYESLGFNPDYLLYEDSYCRYLYTEMSVPRLSRLCFYYYGRCWRYQPLAMLRKIGRQLGVFYTKFCPAFWRGRGIDIAKHYRGTPHAFDPPPYQKQMHDYPPGRAYLAATERLSTRPDVYRQTEAFSTANNLAAEGHLPLLLACLAGLAVLLAVRSPDSRRELLPSGWLVLLFFAYVFGNCLTVAVVHSLDIDRYSSNLTVYAILAEVAGLAWCVEALLCARFRLNPELHDAKPPAGRK